MLKVPTSFDEYIYEPLIEAGDHGMWIRLLILEPGEYEQPISCKLRPFNLLILIEHPNPSSQIANAVPEVSP
jgi:hypothetical protein